MSVQTIQESERDLYRIVQTIISIANKMNACGVITLAAGATSTVVTKDNSRGAVNVSKDDVITFSPMTANAAAALTTTYILQANVAQGSFTITHANAGTTDRTFFWQAR